MQSSLHGMIDKAHPYAEEPERVQLARLEALVRGDNSDHTVKLADGRLSCDCNHYEHERLCAHVLTVERVLKAYIPANAAPFPGQMAAPERNGFMHKGRPMGRPSIIRG